MAKKINSLVIDSSVVLAYLLSEPIAGGYVEKLEMARDGKSVLLAPKLQLYEILNGIKTCVLRKRIPKSDASQMWQKYLAMGIQLCDQDGRGEEIVKVSLDYNLTAYDGAYVVLARDEKVELVSLDDRMVKLDKSIRN